MKSLLASLLMMGSFAIFATPSKWQADDCTHLSEAEKAICYFDLTESHKAEIRQQYQSLGLVYKYYAHPDFTAMPAEQSKAFSEYAEQGIEAYVEFSYKVSKTGQTKDIRLVVVTDEKLQPFLPYYRQAIEQTEFIKLKQEVQAPNLRYYILSPKKEK